MNDFLSQKPNIIKSDAGGTGLMCSEGRSPEEMPSSSYAPVPKTLPSATLRPGMQPPYNERQTPLFPVHTIVLNKQRSSTAYPRPANQGGIRRPGQQYFPAPSSTARQKTEVIGEEGPTVKQHLQQQQKQRREKERVDIDLPQSSGVMLVPSGGPSNMNGKPGVKSYTILPASHMQHRQVNGRSVNSINRSSRPSNLSTRQIIVAQPSGSQTTPPPGVTTFHSQERLSNTTGSRYIITHAAIPGNSQGGSSASGHVSGTNLHAASTSRSSLNDNRFSPVERKASALVAALERKEDADIITLSDSSMYHQQQSSSSYPNSMEGKSVNSPHSVEEIYDSHGSTTIIDGVNVNASFADSLDPGELSQYLGDYSMGDLHLDPLLGSSALAMEDSMESQDHTQMSSSSSSSHIPVKPRAELSDDISTFFGAGSHKPLSDPFFSQLSVGKKDDLADFPEHFLETDPEDEGISVQTAAPAEAVKKTEQISPTGISLVDWVENDNFIMDDALHVNGEDFSQIFGEDNALDCPEFASSIMEDNAEFTTSGMVDGSLGGSSLPGSSGSRISMPVIPQTMSQNMNSRSMHSSNGQSDGSYGDSPSKKRHRSRPMKDVHSFTEGEPPPKARSRKPKSPRSKEVEMEKKLEKAAKMDKKREDERVQKQRKAEMEAAEKAKQLEESERKLQKERETVERVIRIQQELLEREREEAALRKEAQQGSKPRIRNRNSGTSRARGGMKPVQRLAVMPKPGVPGQPLSEEMFASSPREGNPNVPSPSVVWMSSGTSVVPSSSAPRMTVPSPQSQDMYQQQQRPQPSTSNASQNQQYAQFHQIMQHNPANMETSNYQQNQNSFGEQKYAPQQQSMNVPVNGHGDQTSFGNPGSAPSPSTTQETIRTPRSDGSGHHTFSETDSRPSSGHPVAHFSPGYHAPQQSPPVYEHKQYHERSYSTGSISSFSSNNQEEVNRFPPQQQFAPFQLEQKPSVLSEMLQSCDQAFIAYNNAMRPHTERAVNQDYHPMNSSFVKEEDCQAGPSKNIDHSLSSVEKTIEEVIQKMHNEELESIIEGMSSNSAPDDFHPTTSKAPIPAEKKSEAYKSASAMNQEQKTDHTTDDDTHFADLTQHLFPNVEDGMTDDLNAADFVDGLDLGDFDFSQFNTFLEASDELAAGALDLFVDSEDEPSSGSRDGKSVQLEENSAFARGGSESSDMNSLQGTAVVPNINEVDETLVEEIAHDDLNYPTEWLLQMLDEPLTDPELLRLGLCPMNKESFLFEEEEIHYPENISQQESEKYYQIDCDRHDMASLLSFLSDEQINHEIAMMEACMVEDDIEPTEEEYAHKLRAMTENCTGLIYVNAALVDEISRLSQRIVVSTEERKILARRLCHHDRNYIRRLQTAKKRKAENAKRKQEAEAQGLTYEPPKRYRKDEPKSTPPKPLSEDFRDKDLMIMRRPSHSQDLMDESMMRAEKYVKEMQLLQANKPTRGRKPGRGRGSGRGRGRGSGVRTARESQPKKASSEDAQSVQHTDGVHEQPIKDEIADEETKQREERHAELTRRFRAVQARGRGSFGSAASELDDTVKSSECSANVDERTTAPKDNDPKYQQDEPKQHDECSLSQTPSDPSDPGTPLSHLTPDEKPRYGTRQASKRTRTTTSSETTPDMFDDTDYKPVVSTPSTRGRGRGRGRLPRNAVVFDGTLMDDDSKNSSRQSSRSTSHHGSPSEAPSETTKPKRGRPMRPRVATFSAGSYNTEMIAEVKLEETTDATPLRLEIPGSDRSSRSRSRNSKENTPLPTETLKEEVTEEDVPQKPRRGRGRPPASASLVPPPSSASCTPPPPDPDNANNCKKRPHVSPTPYMHELSLLNDGIDPYTPKKDVDDDYEPPAKRRIPRKASEVAPVNRPTRQSQRRKS